MDRYLPDMQAKNSWQHKGLSQLKAKMTVDRNHPCNTKPIKDIEKHFNKSR